ncbi:uncharacterized protein PV09_04308 [Verruconis gallopava]|uniref:Clathrin light chain n=1 Tax=Verruconis gallopava TaxID=253628 RepID=A0A0D1XPT7_9PEZI|nr:uncharacterized protein PV09_04308 [Verruconis gallopava]KIW04556.1 hypothetical protein PV09_04308 [Verruconis gallopava]
MADRFPSIEDFDEGQTEVRDVPADGASSFLERERAALGDDADFFVSEDDKLASVQVPGDDLLGGGSSFPPVDGEKDELSGFESSFPVIDTTNEHMAPGGTITGHSFLPGAPNSYPAPSFSSQPIEDSEPIRQWRERRNAEIARRDEISQAKKESTIKEAQQALDDFYNNYNDKKEKNIAQTRREAEQFLESRDDTTAGGTSWERIAKLVDISGKGAKGGAGGSGKERFRELLVSLRKDENAPGATGI